MAKEPRPPIADRHDRLAERRSGVHKQSCFRHQERALHNPSVAGLIWAEVISRNRVGKDQCLLERETETLSRN